MRITLAQALLIINHIINHYADVDIASIGITARVDGVLFTEWHVPSIFAYESMVDITRSQLEAIGKNGVYASVDIRTDGTKHIMFLQW